MSVAGAAPGLFTADSTGTGQAAALNEDGSYNDAALPAVPGSMIVLFGTGEGQTSPAGVDGKPAADPYPKPVQAVTVRIGGQTAEVLYAGAAPGLVAGVLQLNVRVPSGVASGNHSIVSQVGDVSSRPDVTVSVR